MGRAVPVVPEGADAASQATELDKRLAALRQAASLPGADIGGLLDAAFTEIEGAISLLQVPLARASDEPGRRSADANGAERRVLRAAFADAPVPLFLLAADGTVLRVNKAAGELLGSKPGYATGRSFTSFIALKSRAAVQTQLTAVARSGRAGHARCGLLGPDGVTLRDLKIGLTSLSGDGDRLVVAVTDGSAVASDDDELTTTPVHQPSGDGGVRPAGRRRAGAVEAITQRMDLVTAATRLLLENENFSVSMTLQRFARLLAGELAAWVIVDLERRGRLRRQFVIGPEGPGLAGISDSAAALNPLPGSLPHMVHESGQAVLIAHADDAGILGPGPAEDVPLLMVLGSTSVLSVPISDAERRYGVLTLARQAGQRHLEIADLGLVTELGEQLGLAIRVDHLFRRHTDIADALQANLLPRRLPEIAGVELAPAYVAATDGIEIGADFYDVYQTPAGWGLSVGDVCGKGEEAAAVSAAARHAIRVLAHGTADPAAVLAAANEILLAENVSGGFVTASIAHVQWRDGLLHVTLGSAGHPSAAVIRADGRVQMPGGGGLPLGLLPDAEPGLHQLTLGKGDVLFLYTDGLTQARGRDRSYFQARLTDELAGLAGREPRDVEAAMTRKLLEFTAGNLIDDITMLVLRAGDSPERPARAGAARTGRQERESAAPTGRQDRGSARGAEPGGRRRRKA